MVQMACQEASFNILQYALDLLVVEYTIVFYVLTDGLKLNYVMLLCAGGYVASQSVDRFNNHG